MTDKREGILESILLIPFSRLQYYGGNQLHQLMLTGLDVLAGGLIALVIGVEFQIHVQGLCVGILQFFFTLYGLAFLVSLLMISFRDTFFIQNTVIPIILMTGGYIFPVEVLPFPLRIVSFLISVHKGVYLIRDSMLNGGYRDLDWSWSVSFVPGLIFMVIGIILLR